MVQLCLWGEEGGRRCSSWEWDEQGRNQTLGGMFILCHNNVGY